MESTESRSEGDARHYGHMQYMQQLRNDLAVAKAVSAYCSMAKSYSDIGYQDIAEDATMIQAGVGLAKTSPLAGPFAPAVATVGGILIAVGAVRLVTHTHYHLAKINANAKGMPLEKFPALFDRPVTKNRDADYGGAKLQDKAMGGGADLMRGKSLGLGFPMSEECQWLEKSLDKTINDLEKKINEGTPPKDNKPQIKPGPTPRPQQPKIPVHPPVLMPTQGSADDGVGREPRIPAGDGKGHVGPDHPSGGIYV